MEKIIFTSKPSPPFRLDLTAWALRRRQSNTIDSFDGEKYRRVIAAEDKPLEISVSQSGSSEKPFLKVEVAGSQLEASDVSVAKKQMELLLGLRVDMSGFYRSAKLEPNIADLVRPFRGVKPPRFPSVFEALVNAISCQQVSLAVGVLLLNRLAEKYGAAMNDQARSRAFPSPDDLNGLQSDSLRPLGYSLQKSKYIVGLAKALTKGEVNLEQLDEMNDEQVLAFLQSIPGIGRWSAQYAMLRGLGRLNTFPGDDVGAQNGLKSLLGLRKRPDYQRIAELLEPLKPYSGLVYFHLLLNRLGQEGLIRISNSELAQSTPRWDTTTRRISRNIA